MARLARVILPNHPHHIIQRGNRRQDVFFVDEDYQYYLELLKEWCHQVDIEVWAYCLMTNHIHLIVCPNSHFDLSRAIGETHRRYTRMINFREKWRWYLWQGRFSSFPMEESWLLRAASYVELNPRLKREWSKKPRIIPGAVFMLICQGKMSLGLLTPIGY